MQVKSGESKDVPALLLEKIVDEAEVDGLFEIFYTVCHPQAPFLDPSLHTATWTALHSPFLFTCICTVASRYLSTKRPELYARCRAMAVSLAAKTVFSGLSSVSIVQGCLILAHWNQPGYPSEGDLTYLMSGTAVRMSLELGLHIHKETPTSPTGELDASQLLQGKKNRNRERTWVHCVFTDQSLALQFGKPSMISRESYLMRNLSTWSRHPLAIPSDQAISLIAELHRINTKAIEAFYSDGDSFSGMNERVDHASVIRVYLAQTDNWRSATLGRETATDSGADFRKTWANFLFYHYRVHFLSLGIKLARSKPELAHELTFYALKGYESASALIQLVKEKLGDTCRLRYGMDSTFVYITHSACFLLKLIHPMFSSYIDGIAALAIARDAVSILEKAAVDHFHTPAVYAVFIKTLIGSMGFEDRAALQARSKPSVPLPEFMDAATSQALEPTSADLHQDRAPKFWETVSTPHMSGTPGGAIMPSPYSYGDMDSWDEPSMGMFSRAGSPQGFAAKPTLGSSITLFHGAVNLGPTRDSQVPGEERGEGNAKRGSFLDAPGLGSSFTWEERPVFRTLFEQMGLGSHADREASLGHGASVLAERTFDTV
ncbi:hypothetical protein RQP46_000878 [Phenoliferia psychrophenolica]